MVQGILTIMASIIPIMAIVFLIITCKGQKDKDYIIYIIFLTIITICLIAQGIETIKIYNGVMNWLQ